jgi:hypothetical protein
MLARGAIAGLILLVTTGSTALGIEGYWFVTGGGGAKGDCMSEWLVEWDSSWDPASTDNDLKCRRPKLVTSGGQVGRVSVNLECNDGDGCDHGTVSGWCVFKVGLCYCVDDPATENCVGNEGTISKWCRTQYTPPAGDASKIVTPLEYSVLKPGRTKSDHALRRARCELEESLAGCVQNLTEDNLDDNVSRADARERLRTYDCIREVGDPELPPRPTGFPATDPTWQQCPSASPMLTLVNTVHGSEADKDKQRPLVPGETPAGIAGLKHPARDLNKTALYIEAGANHNLVSSTYKTPLHNITASHVPATSSSRLCVPGQANPPSFCAPTTTKDPLRQFVSKNGYSNGSYSIAAFNGGMCSSTSNLAEIWVPQDDSIALAGTWWNSQSSTANLGPVDKGGGDELRLSCLPPLSGPRPTCE